MNRGTPKDITEALQKGLFFPYHAAIDSVRIHIKDYFSQKFSAAILAHPESEQVLRGLFKNLFDVDLNKVGDHE